MKVGRPLARLFAGAACRAAFPLRSSATLVMLVPTSTAIPGFASARRSYGNTAQLAEDPEEYGLYATKARRARKHTSTRARALKL